MRIEAATADRFDDIATVLNPTGREQACWCMHWRLPAREEAGRRAEYLRELAGKQPAPGLLAYLDEEDDPDQDEEDDPDQAGTVVGWLGLAPKSASRTLQRSRVLPPGHPDTWPTTWAIMCFTVRPGYRRRGVARALLHGAIPYARAHGARVIEGYPVGPEPGRRVPVSAGFVGTVGLFESAGFERVALTGATSGRLPRWVLRLELDG